MHETGAILARANAWQRRVSSFDAACERRFALLATSLRLSPHAAATLIALLGGGLLGTLYWLFVLLFGLDEPLKISVFYRLGDTDYLPLIYALARGEYGEISDFATYGRGFLPFPLVSIAPYALAVALAGNAGFILADFAIGAMRALILQRTLLLLSRRPLASAILAVLLVIVLFDVNAWSYRLPRPFVTQVFYLAGFHLCLRLWLKRGAQSWVWPAGHGVVVAATIQGDLHGGVFLGTAAALTLVAVAWRTSTLMPVLRYGLWFGCGFAVAVLPFALQSLSAPTHIVTRWGAFDHDRAWDQPLVDTIIVPAGLLIALIPLLSRRGLMANEAAAASAVGLLFVLAATISSTVFVLVLGRAIQIYQAYEKIPQIALSMLSIVIVCLVLHRVKSTILLSLMVAIALLAAGKPIAGTAKEAVQIQSQRLTEPGLPFAAHYAPSYRRDVTDIVHRLDAQRSESPQVLGTFDQQFAMLWSIRAGRSLFIPDTFLTMVDDTTIEDRTIGLSRLVGMSTTQFRENLDGTLRFNYFQARFLTLEKWQASPFHMPADPTRYTPAQLARILELRKGDSAAYWNLETPEDEKVRLLAKFVAPQTIAAPDVIVLNNFGLSRNLPGPTAPGYTLTYANPSFRMFLRAPRPGAGAGREVLP